MDYRTLGKTGLKVSPICIGAWQLGGPLFFDGRPDGHPDPGKENVLKLIRELGDRGINHIDSAEQYSNGESERRVGEAISGNREKWIVSTKFGYRVGSNGEREDDSSPPTIMPSLEGSLKRLRTDYIDIYLFHCAPTVENLDESRRILERAKQQGKIRCCGISTANFDRIQVIHQHHLLDVVQYPANLLEPRSDIDEFAIKYNIGTQVRGVMAQGRLSGKYFHRTPQWRTDDRRNGQDVDYQRYVIFEKVLPEGMTMAQAAVRWVLDHPCNHTICMGAKNLTDYETAIAATEMPPLSAEVKKQLEAHAERLT